MLHKTTFYVGGVTQNGEALPDAKVYDRLSVILGDCTIIKGRGYWQGVGEPCFVATKFENQGKGAHRDYARFRAGEICQDLDQTAVLVEMPNEAFLVNADGEVMS